MITPIKSMAVSAGSLRGATREKGEQMTQLAERRYCVHRHEALRARWVRREQSEVLVSRPVALLLPDLPDHGPQVAHVAAAGVGKRASFAALAVASRARSHCPRPSDTEGTEAR
jgi:hypothetical protein